LQDQHRGKKLNAGPYPTPEMFGSSSSIADGDDQEGHDSIVRNEYNENAATTTTTTTSNTTLESTTTAPSTVFPEESSSFLSSFSASVVDFDMTTTTTTTPSLAQLKKALDKLTVTERERAIFDVHGMTEVPVEHPKQIQDWVHEMWTIHIPKLLSDHSGLRIAMGANPKYVQRECIKFLRSEGDWDCSNASKKMGYYFDMKLQYFGGQENNNNKNDGNGNDNADADADAKHPSDNNMKHPSYYCCDCIGRDITLQDDFTDQELEHIKTGFYQFCEERDRSGRIVTIAFPHQMIQYSIPVQTIIKFFMYGCQILTRDESVQRSGRVHIAWGLGFIDDAILMDGLRTIVFDPATREAIGHCNRNLPLRCVATHFCLEEPSLNEYVNQWLIPMSTFNAARVRTHYGDYTECVYELMTVGIATESLPTVINKSNKKTLDDNNQHDRYDNNSEMVDIEFHLGVLETLMKLEQSERQKRSKTVINSKIYTENTFDGKHIGKKQQSFLGPQHQQDNHHHHHHHHDNEQQKQVLTFPGPMDVIMGKGEHNRMNPGNLRYKLLLQESYSGYERATLVERKALVDTILQRVKDLGARFLVLNKKSERRIEKEQHITTNNCNDNNAMSQREYNITTTTPTTAAMLTAPAIGEDYKGGGGGGRGDGDISVEASASSTSLSSSLLHRWTEAPIEKARDKVTHDLRNLRRAEHNNQQKQKKENTMKRDCA
jgi:hypothetical protein